jgi:hypothetical protein
VTYASETTVSPEKSLTEIQQTLKRYGAGKFGYMDNGETIMIAFEMKGRRLRFTLPLPKLADFKRDGANRTRSSAQQQAALDKAIRQKYRALLLTIKAKLESVEAGIETFEQAFMANLLLPSGETIGEWAIPQVQVAYETGRMPPLLGSGA